MTGRGPLEPLDEEELVDRDPDGTGTEEFREQAAVGGKLDPAQHDEGQEDEPGSSSPDQRPGAGRNRLDDDLGGEIVKPEQRLDEDERGDRSAIRTHGPG